MSKIKFAILMLFLSGCGGESTEPQKITVATPVKKAELDPYLEQKAVWRACDASAFEGIEEIVASERFRCADIRAPLDWANPSRGDITVAVTRLAVANPAARRGSLLFNPGGPGGDGIRGNLDFLLRFASLWGDERTATPLERQLFGQYDLIGFSPRGSGSSSQLTCGANERRTVVPWGNDPRQAALDGLLRNAEITSNACQKNPLTPYISTEQTARDMDLIRTVLRDDKLNYIGYSYGTWLGAWYAALFPERVGRMVLDSTMDFSAPSIVEGGVTLQPPAWHRATDKVIGAYAARHNAYFGLGQSPDAIGQLFASLPLDLKGPTASALSAYSAVASRDRIDDGVLVFVAAKGVQQLTQWRPDATLGQLLEMARRYVFADDPDLNARAVSLAASRLIPQYFAAKQPFGLEADPLTLTPAEAVNTAVICNDSIATRKDRQFWIDARTDYSARYGLSNGGASMITSTCMFWPSSQPPVIKPTVDQVAKAPAILMVQSEFDGLTATEGALRTFNKLPNARLIHVDGEYTHGVFPYNTACVDEPVVRYLVDGTLPARRANCQGRKFSRDESESGAASQPAVQNRSAMQVEPGGPGERDAAIRNIHRSLTDRSSTGW